MLVGKRMSKEPVTIGPEDNLAQAQERMEKGGFRRLPVLEGERLVGIITDRDLRQHLGYLERTKVNVAMTEELVTVSPQTTIEQAAELLLKHKIGGLPVVEDGKLIGIITASDILKTFLEVMGASEEGCSRIDLLLSGASDLANASMVIAEEGGEILGIGTYREKWEENPVCYIRLRTADAGRLAATLRDKGYTVLGLHP